MSIKAGKLGDHVFTADIHGEYYWGGPFPLHTVSANVKFFDQEVADKFREGVQALLEEASQ